MCHFGFVCFSASSGNSAEVTIKDLKRSKNKKQKKKAKTKASQSQKNKATEPTPDTKAQDTKSTNNKSATPTVEQQKVINNIDATKTEAVAANVNDTTPIEKPKTGKLLFRFPKFSFH